MTNKSDTPFTDAHEHNMGSVTEPHYVVDADKVSGLERELNALRAENELMRPVVEAVLSWWQSPRSYVEWDMDLILVVEDYKARSTKWAT